ncbi:hypothetical protein ACFVH6_38710 [Spirillospora sp. NPDC127200]
MTGVLVLVLLVVAALVGLRWLVELAETRRAVRWAHALVRFCGDSGCGVCRSRAVCAKVGRRPVELLDT